MTKIELLGQLAERDREIRRLRDEIKAAREQNEILTRRRARQQRAGNDLDARYPG